MMKMLSLTVVAIGFLTFAPYAAAQDNGALSEMPMDEAASVRTAPASTFVNRGVGPINMRPNAYMAHDTAVERDDKEGVTTPGRRSYPSLQASTAAAAYNQRLQAARQYQQTRAQSRIASPFPEGFGE